ncbi:O-antigen ligase family protein [Sphingomonas sp.]|jgi:hypothetical protein|uniref:O-antigen ligase family protein n=1 Tax=Sphingomonas sp. TaxID=28214 RepID=UPI002E326658|nr:O-antigen ligase family protein [Sphingomonas sp.]HEX4695431.1 O-antigen ligase family protein [Sphingomonas sp.]
MAAHGAPRLFGQSWRLTVAVVLIAALALTGGASRYDEDQQMVARVIAVVAVTATLWPLDWATLRRQTAPLIAAGGIFGLVLVQLIPLPPSLWAALPGHDAYAVIAEASGTAGWRPLSLTPDLTLNALGGLLPALAAGLAALHLDTRSRQRLVMALVAVAAAGATLGLVQLAMGGDSLHLFRESSENAPVGLFANRNHQAVLMACALPMTGALAGLKLREGGNRPLIVFTAIGLGTLFLLALILTASRMGLLLAVIGVAGAVVGFRASGQRLLPKGARGWATGAGGVALILASMILLAARGGAIARLIHPDPAGETRSAMLAPLIETARAFLPLGSGFGSFDSVYRRFEPDAQLSTIYMNQAHNEPLQLAIEGGVPALILLTIFCSWWARTAIRAAGSRESTTRRSLAIAAIAMTVILMASSLVDYPLRTPLLGALFAIACVEMRRAARPA